MMDSRSMLGSPSLKARLAAGDSVYGAWIGSGSATNAEILAHAGFDFLVIDNEHGLGEIPDAVAMLRAAESSGTPCIVRTPWNDPVWIKRILDAGATSLMIPSVETAELASAAVRACRYPPQGTRGYASSVVRASTYGFDSNYTSKANENLLIVLQIESAAAVENAAEICEVEGVDVVFIGVNDLAGSIGRLEQLDHPDVRRLVKRAEDTILGAGKALGTVPNQGASWQELFERGYNMIVGPHDVAMLRDAATDAIKGYKEFRVARSGRKAATPGCEQTEQSASTTY
jgi:4-hydroxy-2-oxoheptanedioate aldolase